MIPFDSLRRPCPAEGPGFAVVVGAGVFNLLICYQYSINTAKRSSWRLGYIYYLVLVLSTLHQTPAACGWLPRRRKKRSQSKQMNQTEYPFSVSVLFRHCPLFLPAHLLCQCTKIEAGTSKLALHSVINTSTIYEPHPSSVQFSRLVCTTLSVDCAVTGYI